MNTTADGFVPHDPGVTEFANWQDAALGRVRYANATIAAPAMMRIVPMVRQAATRFMTI